MKKSLLFTILFLSALAQAQNLITENFDEFPTSWTQTNQSVPVGPAMWKQGGGTLFPNAFNGGATSFGQVDYNSTTATGNISNWLITPVVSLKNGDVISFYSRKGGTTGQLPDRLEMRLSTHGAASANPTGGSDGLGDFTVLAVTINPFLTTTGYPLVWTQYTYTISGLPTETACKVAFRYYVTQGGPTGANANVIGIDAFSIDRPLAATAEFHASDFSIYPNPATNTIYINQKSNASIRDISIIDASGRAIKSFHGNTSPLDVSSLRTGIYFLNITTDIGKSTIKFARN